MGMNFMKGIVRRRAVVASVVSAFAVLISPVIASAADDTATKTNKVTETQGTK